MRPERSRRAGMVLAAIVFAVAALGLWYARDLPFTEPEGAFVYPASDDFIWARQAQFNPLGALVTIAIAGAALVGEVRRWRAVTLAAAAVSFVAAAFMLFDLNRAEPLLGGRGGNLSMLLVLAIGLAALELSPALAPIAPDHPADNPS